MKKLSILLVLVVAACAPAEPFAKDQSNEPAQPAAAKKASDDTKTFYREGLAGVDFSGLDAVAKERALQILNSNLCDCGCGMTIAQCRVEDKTCPSSPKLAAAVVNAIRTGASDAQALVALKAARQAATAGSGNAPAPQAIPAVDLKLDDSPSMGPADAPIVIAAFEDFQ
ncbi:MAG TPA: hypothetical protein VNI57_13885 [Candidatus Saccharimonadales bacterium]|nr:hypothetical protein [Candidatus Saccharimonadales bacterium]